MLFKGDTLDRSRTKQAAEKKTFSLGFSYEVVPRKTHLLKASSSSRALEREMDHEGFNFMNGLNL